LLRGRWSTRFSVKHPEPRSGLKSPNVNETNEKSHEVIFDVTNSDSLQLSSLSNLSEPYMLQNNAVLDNQEQEIDINNKVLCNKSPNLEISGTLSSNVQSLLVNPNWFEEMEASFRVLKYFFKVDLNLVLE